jgi:hypothetical protein
MNAQPCERDLAFVSRCLYDWQYGMQTKGGSAKVYGDWRLSWLRGACAQKQLQEMFHCKPLHEASSNDCLG